MRRVLVVEASGNLWGSERSLLDLLRGKPDLDIAVCCPPGMPLNEELRKLGVRTLPYYVYGLHEKSRGQRLRAAFGVLRACLEFRADVIHLNQSGSYKVVLPAAVLLGTPIVAHIRIFEDVAYLAAQRPSRRRLRGLIAISRAVEADIRRSPPLAALPAHLLYDAYQAAPEPSPGSPERASRVACVGRLVPIKGQDILVGALELLQRAGEPVDCLMVGDGDAAFVRELKRKASGLGAAVRWTGFVSETVPLLRGCTVLACPSHREPLGRVIFEAWDAGAVPVVFAASGGAAEIVSACDGGIVYERQTADCLAAALRQALRLPAGDRARLVANGRAWMEQNCNPQAYAGALSLVLSAI